MPCGLYNWTFKDVTKFLKDHGFKHTNTEGSHYYYTKIDGYFRIVRVPFHGKKALKPRTLKGIILQSGIARSEWLKQ